MEYVAIVALCLIGIPILNTLSFALLLLYYHEKFLKPVIQLLEKEEPAAVAPEAQIVYLRSDQNSAHKLSEEERERFIAEARNGY